MSVRSTWRALPTVMRVGLAEAVAYRAEMLVWVLATTMPLIMMALWTAVARDAPVGRFDSQDFVAYFLATFIVRQLTGTWVAWQLNYEVRQGTLAQRLLRPFHPLVAYGVEHLAAIPMRLVVAVPVAFLAIALVGQQALPRTVGMWAIWFLSIVGGFLISFLASAAIGTLSFFMQSSIKVMEVWFMLFMVLSGYLFPLDLLPPWALTAVNLLPFRYQIGLPVEVMTGLHDWKGALLLLAGQWVWVSALLAATVLAWRAGLRRFAAFGG
ncbi:MAG: ABC transporter permease [Myxococcota bacterium]